MSEVGPGDAGPVALDQGSAADSGARDAGRTVCSVDGDCTDGVFCNGPERCMPSAAGAGANGCVAGAPPCDAAACNESSDSCRGMCDADNDGAQAEACGGADCDDNDPRRFPGATEVCDAADVDEDCDARTFGRRDGDGDMFLDALCCNVDGMGTRRCGDDCDDTRPTVNTAAPEVCEAANIDNNCDGRINEGVLNRYYRDADGDGVGLAADSMEQCAPSNPYRATTTGDCDDANPQRYPGFVEVCDNVDNDCNGMVDDGTMPVPWYPDVDGDNFGARGSSPVVSCTPVARHALNATDCDDAIADTNPAAAEACNGRDDDCDGQTDEGLTVMQWRDADGDGYGDASMVGPTCPATGYVTRSGDCDDTSRFRFPTNAEVCDGLDNDCNTLLDAFNEDDDRDGRADNACAGFGGADCNDVDPLIYRGAPEPCNDVDNDCSGDEEDGDNDRHAPPGAACTATATFQKDDCNDADPAIHGGQPDVCDGRDNDCNTVIDDPATAAAACQAARSTGTCVVGNCVRSCEDGYADCDGNSANGCEVDTQTSPLHCGGCGLECGVGSTCVQGLCDQVVQLELGLAHGCALRARGRVTCWGSNAQRSVGNNSTVNALQPVELTGLTAIAQIATSASHTCAVDASGRLWCWGRNDYGQSGQPSASATVAIPTLVPGVTGVAEVATGFWHTCFRTTAGAVRCFGRNHRGQLGDNSTNDATAPVNVAIAGVAQLTAGTAHTCARLTSGSVSCWGDDAEGQLGNDAALARSLVPVTVSGVTTATVIDAGYLHTCAVLANRTVQCWGKNIGRLGNNVMGPPFNSGTPVAVSGVADAVRVSCGDLQTCILRASGAVVCSGEGTSYALGNASTAASFVPGPVTGLVDARLLATGSATGCALRNTGALVCWGFNSEGQLGNDSTSTAQVSTRMYRMAADLEVDVGGTHACARRATGEVLCWGENGDGQVGNGTFGANVNVPVWVDPVRDAVAIAVGSRTSCALRVGGGVQCWGLNGSGETGDSTVTTPRPSPRDVVGINDAVRLAAGGRHACVRRATGAIWCWGNNNRDQTGSRSGQMFHATAVASVGVPANVRDVVAGDQHTCVRTASGAAWCWGFNQFGQLGFGAMTSSNEPAAPVMGLPDFDLLVSADNTTCGLRAGRTALSCWGVNSRGQVGDGTVVLRPAPTSVSTPPASIAALAAGSQHVCARTQTGSTFCWGDNTQGQLGDTTNLDRRTPTPISMTTFSASRTVAAGGNQTCATRNNGGRSELWCWGANTFAQLGTGMNTPASLNSPQPTIVE